MNSKAIVLSEGNVFWAERTTGTKEKAYTTPI